MRRRLIGLAALSAVALLCSTLFAGYLFGRHEYLLFNSLVDIESKLFGSRLAPNSAVDEGTFDLDSIFLRLNGQSVKLPKLRPGNGGGLTSVGDDIVLVTHDGRIFAASDVDDVRQTAVATPDNGFDAYYEVSQTEKYSHQWHNYAIFRYNDVSYFEVADTSGLLLSYTEFDADAECYTTAVAKLEFESGYGSIDAVRAQAEDWDVIYRTAPCLPLKDEWRAIEGHMAGGRMAVGSDGKIVLASGDYSWDGVYAPVSLPQDPANDYGKVIEIDMLTGDAEHLSIGHRNLQGITFDRNGHLWTAEHGVRGGDELNRIERGGNYGWPEETLGTLYTKLPMPNTRSYGRHEDFDPPVFAWLPSIAISSLIEIDGFHESWDGDLLLASLKDQSLHRIRIQDDRAMFAERIEVGASIRYAHQHTDGRLVLWTNSRELVFLEPTDGGYIAGFIEDFVTSKQLDSATSTRVTAAVTACMECHSFDDGNATRAPGLASVYGSAIASTDFSGYSKSLREKSGTWDKESLVAFLDSPDSFATGTLMPDPGIEDPIVLETIASLLEEISNAAE